MTTRHVAAGLLAAACLCAGALALHDHDGGYKKHKGLYKKKHNAGFYSGCNAGGKGSPPPDTGGGTPVDGPSGGSSPPTAHHGASGRGAATGAGAARTASGDRSVRSGAATYEAEEAAWWTWWSLQRRRYLPARRLTAPDGRQSDAPPAYLERGSAVQDVLPRLAALLSHRDAGVRAAAAVAYGRLAGEAGVDALLPLLGDKDLAVRERAILALGATGAPRAAPTLLALALEGRSGEVGLAAHVSPDAEPLAILALGVGRRHGMGASVDGFVAEMARREERGTHPDRALAALLFHTLHQATELGRFAFERSGDADAPTALRCRAVEALVLEDDPAVLTTIDRALHHGQLELRRSAALCLGSWTCAGVLEELGAHLAMESEETVRGFLVLSIGSQGGPSARHALQELLDEDDAVLRPWVAFALGDLAAEDDDDAARAALREALAEERSQSARFALMLACGVSRDASAVPALADALATSRSAEERAVAATALALVGGRAAHAVLREALPGERSPDVRAALAEALGPYGDPDDVPALARALLELSDPAQAERTGWALGTHGTPEALAALVVALEHRDTDAVVRAAAADAIGLCLAPFDGPVLMETVQGSNFHVLPDWLDAAIAGTSL